MSEADLVHDVRMLSTGKTRLFRNNVGRFKDLNGNYVQFGLCPGSADLVGWRTVTIRPKDVGNDFAIFTAIECKAPGGVLAATQEAFLRAVQVAGGFAGVAYEVDDAKRILTLGEI